MIKVTHAVPQTVPSRAGNSRKYRLHLQLSQILDANEFELMSINRGDKILDAHELAFEHCRAITTRPL